MEYGTGVLGGGGRIPLAKSDEYGFDGRVTPRLFHKPRLGPKRPRIRKPFHLGPATLHGDNMRGLTARQINGNVQFVKLEKVSPLEAKIAYHIEQHATHLAKANEARKTGDFITKTTHMKMADTHAAIVRELTDKPKENFGKFDEWMDLSKKFDASKHPREYSGEFAGKPAEKTSRFAGGAAGAVGGYVIGTKHGRDIGSKIGMKATKLYHSAETAISGKQPNWHTHVRHEMNEAHNAGIGARIGEAHGAKIGGVVLGTVGAMAGAEIGHHLDSFLRRRRAIKAGKLDQYNRLNSGVSTRPNSVKQLKATANRAKSAANKVGQAHQFVSQFSKFDEWMGDDVLEKAGQKRPNAQNPVGNYIGAAYLGTGAGLVAGHLGVPKVGRLASKAVVRTGMLGYKAAHHIDKFADKSLDRDNYKQAESRLKMANKAESIGTKLVSFGNKIKFKPRAGVGAAAGLAGGLYLAHKVNNPVKKADGELNSIARKSLVELAKDMYSSGMQSAATGIFDRAFGVPGNSNPQPVAHVNPGNHFASGWHWANGTPPAAPVASL
jgi:hypothetical protein